MVVLKVIVWNSSNFNISSCNSSGSNKIDSNCDRKNTNDCSKYRGR